MQIDELKREVTMTEKEYMDKVRCWDKSLPGIEPQGIPGKDFIPVEWVDACERYGKWKIVKVEKEPQGLDEAAEEYSLPNEEPLVSYTKADLRQAFKAGAKWRDAQIQKLPDNLDEAAEEYAWGKEEPLADGERVSCMFHPNINAFKNGAKWMKEQGQTYNAVAIQQYDLYGNAIPDAIAIKTIVSGFNDGDKVIVQIRKKE